MSANPFGVYARKVTTIFSIAQECEQKKATYAKIA